MKKSLLVAPIIFLLAASCNKQVAVQQTIQTPNQSTQQDTSANLVTSIKQYLINKGTTSSNTNVRVQPESAFPKQVLPNYQYFTFAYFESTNQPSSGASFDVWELNLSTNEIIGGKLEGKCFMHNVTSEQQAINLVKSKTGETPIKVNLEFGPSCFWVAQSPLADKQAKGRYEIYDNSSADFVENPIPQRTK